MIASLLVLALTVQPPIFSLPPAINPTAVLFTPSGDQAAIDRYDLDLMNPDDTVLQTINLGKPTPDPLTGECRAAINVQPVKFGSGYYVRLRAVAGTASSDNAISQNSFTRQPGGPSKVIVK